MWCMQLYGWCMGGEHHIGTINTNFHQIREVTQNSLLIYNGLYVKYPPIPIVYIMTICTAFPLQKQS